MTVPGMSREQGANDGPDLIRDSRPVGRWRVFGFMFCFFWAGGMRPFFL